MPARLAFACRSCSATAPKWAGQCPACQAWNTLEQAPPAGARAVGRGLRPAGPAARPMVDVDPGEARPVPTGLPEVDRVLAGGLVPGSVTLLGGEPGIGKSTLVLQAVSAALAPGGRALYLAAEEAAPQVRARAERLGALADGLWVVDEPVVDDLASHLDATGAFLVVVDSIQTVRTADGATPGSVSQVRDCAQHLTELAKRRGVAVVLVGHVTKDGSLAGPRQLEHLVDTVLTFEGDRHHGLRQLRAVKHRYGPTSELGLFEMTEAGLAAVPDASGLFLADRLAGVPGSVVHPMIDGRRPLLVEVQALVGPAPGPPPGPRRWAEGVDAGRLAVVLAVLERRVGVRLAGSDVHALAVGGVRVVEPAADLALALALVSSTVGRPVAAGLVACGEVGLAGEVRSVGGLGRRLAEAERLGFQQALVPASSAGVRSQLEVVPVATVAEAAAAAGLLGIRRSRAA